METHGAGKRQRHKQEYREYADRLVASELEDPNSRLGLTLAYEEEMIAASAPLARLTQGKVCVIEGENEVKLHPTKYGVATGYKYIPVALPIGYKIDPRDRLSANNITQLVLYADEKRGYVAGIYGIDHHKVAGRKYDGLQKIKNPGKRRVRKKDDNKMNAKQLEGQLAYMASVDALIGAELQDPASHLAKVLAHDEQMIAASASLARL